MGLLDNIATTLRKGLEVAKTRGEEAASAAKIRYEIFNLNRELDATYNRLGRAYHAGGDLLTLQPLRDEIDRLSAEISAREKALAEVGQPSVVEGEFTAEGGSATVVAPGVTVSDPATPGSTDSTLPPAPTPTTVQGSAPTGAGGHPDLSKHEIPGQGAQYPTTPPAPAPGGDIPRAPIQPNTSGEATHQADLRKNEHLEAEQAAKKPDPHDL
ncbi:hypothetical protein HNR42_003051 [Deinobacterium chartae]|uniref:Uncharacterized protein n=1 Tax=Deinobacterium chartae TaxID=521158 RepID=A0A841I579_9DEIO|nr:hypothetical protein [Deinobacterium chartae]MBB6099598.1 hypothetical protein [Deinobacterium chartae]